MDEWQVSMCGNVADALIAHDADSALQSRFVKTAGSNVQVAVLNLILEFFDFHFSSFNSTSNQLNCCNQ